MRFAAIGLLTAVGVFATAASATGMDELLSPQAFVRFLAEQPIEKSLPDGFATQGRAFGYVRGSIMQGRPQPPPHAVGVVEIGIKSACCPAGITYTVYPSAEVARAWLLGDGPKPTFSIWRLKQLNSSSLPHPRLSGTVPGYRNSVIVESAGHERIDTRGLTEMDVLVGNVIVNVTTYSRTSTEHGNRLGARLLIDAAVGHLRAAVRGQPSN
jgi:hypothetical protein